MARVGGPRTTVVRELDRRERKIDQEENVAQEAGEAGLDRAAEESGSETTDESGLAPEGTQTDGPGSEGEAAVEKKKLVIGWCGGDAIDPGWLGTVGNAEEEYILEGAEGSDPNTSDERLIEMVTAMLDEPGEYEITVDRSEVPEQKQTEPASGDLTGALLVDCPVCGVKAGQPCEARGKERAEPHAIRVKEWKKSVKREERKAQREEKAAAKAKAKEEAKAARAERRGARESGGEKVLHARLPFRMGEDLLGDLDRFIEAQGGQKRGRQDLICRALGEYVRNHGGSEDLAQRLMR
jgi:hypothetical protein